MRRGILPAKRNIPKAIRRVAVASVLVEWLGPNEGGDLASAPGEGVRVVKNDPFPNPQRLENPELFCEEGQVCWDPSLIRGERVGLPPGLRGAEPGLPGFLRGPECHLHDIV